MMKNYQKCFLIVLIGLISMSTQAQEKYTINGYLTDQANGESLIGASVIIKGTTSGAVSNLYGFYSLTLEAGTYQLEYQYIGFSPIVKEVVMDQNLRLDIELLADQIQLDEIVVEAEPEDINVSGVQMSTNKLEIKTIQKLPAFMGEVDVLKGIQQLPGVATVGEGASGFNVRGGGVGQNLVLLDEAPVYNSSHLLGFFSVFNPDAVKDVQLIKGGIPARYGGRISSILDVRMKEGNAKKFQVQGGIGTVFSRLAIEGPIKKDKASFIIAGRRSYVDVLARPFTDVLDDGAALNFYDLTMKTNVTINDKNRVFVSGYFGRDNFLFDANQGFNWGNQTATIRWNHLFNDRLFSNFTAFYSNYDYELAFGDTADDKFTWNSQIRTYDFKPEFSYYINPQNELSFGGEILQYDFEPANAVGVSNGEVSDITLPAKQSREVSAYIENSQVVNQKLTIKYGLRYSNYAALGPGTYYEYQTNELGKRAEVISETKAEDGEVIQTYSNFEPRFSMKYQVNAKASIKASYNRTAQYIHLISNTTASNPLDVWTPSTNNIKPQTGQQIAIGWFQNFGSDNDFEASVETYFRPTENQIDYIDGADLLINQYLEGDLLSGEGRAYGVELFVKKNTGKFTGWISYTLAKTELKVAGINNGEWYPTRFDQRHNFKISGIYEPGNRWTFSTNFSYITGTPTTFPTSRYLLQGYLVPYAAGNGRNNFRVPDYHRLDIAATLDGKKKKRNGKVRKNESFWVFSIYNVYSRRNPFSIYFAQEDGRVIPNQPIDSKAVQVSIIGSMVPSVSYNFKF